MKAQLKKAALAVLIALGAGSVPATAALNAVDPGPYVVERGFFPQWYQDFQGRALELCLSSATIAPDAARGIAGGAGCTLLANPGIFDPALPIVFPTNFPDESFWFMGDAVFSQNGVDVTYVSNMEAAFGTGDPVPDAQISFSRIRIRVSLPADAPPGIYTITHPYGVETFGIAAGGTKVINMTRDIGIGAPGDFTGALGGDIGPFLMDASVPALGPIPSDVPGEFFIGDPNSLRPVVGSPFGTNFVRVQDPNGVVLAESNLFAVMGKVFAGTLPTPLAIERATYSRTATAAQQDVFAKAPPTSNPVDLTDANATVVPMADGDGNGAWYAQSANDPALPATVSVAATNAVNNNTLTTKTGNLVDLVTITRAEYSAGVLTVEALSSDEVQLPELTVNGQTLSLVGAGPFRTATLTGLTIPPAFVTVSSANGGSDTEEVALLP